MIIPIGPGPEDMKNVKIEPFIEGKNFWMELAHFTPVLFAVGIIMYGISTAPRNYTPEQLKSMRFDSLPEVRRLDSVYENRSSYPFKGTPYIDSVKKNYYPKRDSLWKAYEKSLKVE